MSSALSADKIISAFKRWGISYIEHSKNGVSWRNHNRAGHGPWGDMHGFLNHHTASKADGSSYALGILWDGRSDLPGPLCNFALDREGVVHCVGYGRANHAGLGAQNVYNALLLDDAPPAPSRDVVDGNSCLYGVEVMNDGLGEDYPDAQIEALVKLNAAILEAHGWTANSSIQHKEWTSRKTDMSNIDGKNSGQFLRYEVARALKEGPSYQYPKPAPVVVPTPAVVEPAPAPVPVTENGGNLVKFDILFRKDSDASAFALLGNGTRIHVDHAWWVAIGAPEIVVLPDDSFFWKLPLAV